MHACMHAWMHGYMYVYVYVDVYVLMCVYLFDYFDCVLIFYINAYMYDHVCTYCVLYMYILSLKKNVERVGKDLKK